MIRHRAGGDLLLATPALRALRRGAPALRIDVLVARGMVELLEGNPDVDRIIEIDRRSMLGQARLYARLATARYDLVLDLVSNPRSAFLTAVTRAKTRIGYDLPGRRFAYSRKLPREPVGPEGPVIRYAPQAALDFVRMLGLPEHGEDLTFTLSTASRERMGKWFESSGIGRGRPIAACLPAGSWPAKTWPAERFSAVMDSLAHDADVLWLWGPGEQALAESCRARMGKRSWLAPATGWQDLGSLLARCSLLLSNDSGPKHLAVALGTPTVTIFGPTHPGTWHPPGGPHSALWVEGLQCLHCNATRCPLEEDRHLRCMRDLSVERVAAACRERLRSGVGSEPCASR